MFKDYLNISQIHSSELEDIINEIDGVNSSSVVGIFDPITNNDIIFGFVVKNLTFNELTEDFIEDYVNSKVIDAKKLRGGVHFLDFLPVSINGKIQKSDVKKIAEAFLRKDTKQ